METGFHLAKWYFDCISDDGSFCIGYTALLQWKKFTLHYTSVLHGGAKSTPRSFTSFLPSASPLLINDRMEWSCKDIDAEGTWKRKFDLIERTLLENEQGSIHWSCLMPGADTTMRIGGDIVSGLGYVELLEMTIPPWKLPIDELRWGRFLSQTDAIVWIEWRGSHPLRLVNHNGRMIECPTLDDSTIGSENDRWSLALDRSTVIRSGPIIKTALKKIPGIEMVFPKNILHAEECKWLSWGSLRGGDHQLSNGFAIHEIVRFK
jgi:hypothetical protein